MNPTFLFLNFYTLFSSFYLGYLEGHKTPLYNGMSDSHYETCGKLTPSHETIDIQVYYETLCPFSKNFYNVELYHSFLNIGPYLNIKLYPYGNAKTIRKDGGYEFKCQHGPEECYGNKLHVCAIEHIGSYGSFLFNACLMASSSNDEYADKCAESLSIKVKTTKQCAKGKEGIELLKRYGDKSKQARFRYVSYVLLNDKPLKWNGTNFMKNVCDAFKYPPRECK